jgi:pimeloyl-ACP methyl ester carboxylesterase
MSEPRQKSLRILGPHGFHKAAYVEWGDPANPRVLIAAHGAVRQSRDFDVIAAALSDEWRVAAPDLPGRGDSDWLADKSDYGQELYLNVYVNLIARLGVEQVAWLGTSLGGALGLQLAARPGSPIVKLVLNDIGPVRLPVGPAPAAAANPADLRFADLDEVEAYIRETWPYGIKEDTIWRAFAIHGTRKTEDGRYRLHYDPAAIGGRPPEQANADPWALWDSLRIPVLILRGSLSNILPKEVAEEATRRGPRAQLIEYEGIGHWPSLTEPHQIESVRAFLRD